MKFINIRELSTGTSLLFCARFTRLENRRSECRRARDAKRDIPVPLSPCARATTCTCRGRPAPGPRLRHFAPPPDPYDEWLDGVSDALASGLRQLRDLRPLRHFGQPLAPTPTADYPPRASRFPGGQRRIILSIKNGKMVYKQYNASNQKSLNFINQPLLFALSRPMELKNILKYQYVIMRNNSNIDKFLFITRCGIVF